MELAYPFTPDEDANRLLAQNGTALLIGLCLDQQVRTEKAFAGPHELLQRLGFLDARRIAAMPLGRLTAIFRRPPALHRYPAMMARRVHALCTVIAEEYANDGARLWHGVTSADDVYRRLRALPGFGDGKASTGVHILVTYGKQRLEGWRRFANDEHLPWEFRNGKRVQA